jgi:hypothetical protein
MVEAGGVGIFRFTENTFVIEKLFSYKDLVTSPSPAEVSV